MAAIASKFEQKDPSASDFEKQKARSLSGIDNSRKGSIDQPIVDLVEFINKHDDFFTTSCCSGRIAVISEVSFFSHIAGQYMLLKSISSHCIYIIQKYAI